MNVEHAIAGWLTYHQIPKYFVNKFHVLAEYILNLLNVFFQILTQYIFVIILFFLLLLLSLLSINRIYLVDKY